jgi:thiol-disulfide isomerase/thioredoxin
MAPKRRSRKVTTPAVVSTEPMHAIEFSARWCAPCKAVKPRLKTFAANHPELTLQEVDIETANGGYLADLYEVRSIPKLVFLGKGKKVLATATGTAEFARLEEIYGRAVAAAKEDEA